MNYTGVKLTPEEWRLIVSALEFDKVGTWGDGREEAIQSLLAKIKRERVSA